MHEPRLRRSPMRRRRRGLIAWIARRPDAAFGAFLALHFAVWTALPTLLYANLPLDLIEALTYGREWVLGSDKLPPLPWWLVEIMYRVFGVDAAYYALAEIVVIAAFALVYATARPLVGPARALVAVLIIDGLHYFQYTAVKFNHDVIQLPFWALAGYAFHAALKRGQTRPLAAARLRLRRRAVGKIFRRRSRRAVCAVSAVRSRRAAGAAHAAVRGSASRSRSSSRARMWSGCSRTTSCRSPMWTPARRRRAGGSITSCIPAFFAAGQIFFMLPALVDRRHVRLAAAGSKKSGPPRCRRISAPTTSTAASSPCSPSVRRSPCWR